MGATSNTWPLDTENVANVTKELNISFNLNGHLWLMATSLKAQHWIIQTSHLKYFILTARHLRLPE